MTLTIDTDEDWINGSATDTLFIWDDEGDFVYWTGAEDDSWMNADNWSGNAVPDSDDIVVFDGTHDDDVTLSGPLSPYSIGELRIAEGYTGTITLSFPLSVGSLQMAGGTIDQPYSGYGSDLTIAGAANWTGGVLNSTANAASVIFNGATVVVNGSDDLETGSEFQFINATALIAPSMPGPASITFNNAPNLYIVGTSNVIIGSGKTTVVNGNVDVNGGTVAIMGATSLNSLHVHHGGSAFIGSPGAGTGKILFTGTVPGWGSTSVLVLGGSLNIQNGNTLDGGSNNIDVSGFDSTSNAGELNTFAASNKSQTTATITASKLILGASAGTLTVTIEKDSLAPGDHVFSVLKVTCAVDWERGAFVPTVGSPGTRDRWTSDGVIKIKGSTTSIAPIAASGATGSQDYTLLESGGKFAEWADNNGAFPGLPGAWSYKSGTAYGQPSWAMSFTI